MKGLAWAGKRVRWGSEIKIDEQKVVSKDV